VDVESGEVEQGWELIKALQANEYVSRRTALEAELLG
jgi:hypothetical protein